ncbi:putative lipase atg15 [Smittium mucronatum]|uniref:triacylglycerol lipase n=1 Tax=Smittium mucronatum TaxID=133383 RepID=A0A1R0GQH5_9FUNG|nr:putative lipase atg15 [Smittium mucronatum]
MLFSAIFCVSSEISETNSDLRISGKEKLLKREKSFGELSLSLAEIYEQVFITDYQNQSEKNNECLDPLNKIFDNGLPRNSYPSNLKFSSEFTFNDEEKSKKIKVNYEKTCKDKTERNKLYAKTQANDFLGEGFGEFTDNIEDNNLGYDESPEPESFENSSKNLFENYGESKNEKIIISKIKPIAGIRRYSVRKGLKRGFNDSEPDEWIYSLKLSKRNTNLGKNNNLSGLDRYEKIDDYFEFTPNFLNANADKFIKYADLKARIKNLYTKRDSFVRSEIGERMSFWKLNSNFNNNSRENRYLSDNDNLVGAEYLFKNNIKYNNNDGLLIPDVTDKKTLIGLAKMCFNSYYPEENKEWLYLGENWDHQAKGWDTNGLKAQIYTSKLDRVVIIAFKGTSFPWISNVNFETAKNDRLNVNMVIDVIKRYPGSYVALTGHSLGGSIASLVGLVLGVPAVSFEAPGDQLAATRLGFPKQSLNIMQRLPIWHIGHKADPIYNGECVGIFSACQTAGYVMESKCHVGNKCVLDTEKDLGYESSIFKHQLEFVINEVLDKYGDQGFKIPTCKPFTNCMDCEEWKFN